MSKERIEVDVVYDHEKYGEVLVTGIAKMYDEWDVRGPQEDIEAGQILVYFYDDYDGYGGMNPMPLSETVGEFAKASVRVEEHNTLPVIEKEEYDSDAVEALKEIHAKMEDRDYEGIDYTRYLDDDE